MQILFIASRFPYPPYQGDRWRAFHQLRGLAQSHEVTLVTPAPDHDLHESLEIVRPLCKHLEVVPSSRWRRLARLVQAPVSVLPMQTLYSFEPGMLQTVRSLLATRSFDLAHVQLVRMAPMIQELHRIPTVLDLIDALSLNMARRAKRERGLKSRIFTVEAARTRRYELALMDLYDRLIVSSTLDRQAIGDFDNLHVVPNFVDIAAHPFHFSGHEPATIIFTGRMSYHPNVEGAIWFAAEILPLIRRQVPSAHLMIVGADPAPAVQRLGELDGVTVTGRVPRIQDYLGRATVAVAPLRSGSGMQIKVIEAMAAGTPVVATSYALGGSAADWDQDLLVADDAASFAEQVTCLIHNPALARRIAHNAREMVERNYTWERSIELLGQVYDLAVARQAAAAQETPAAQERQAA